MWDEHAAVAISGDYYRGRREALGLSKAEVARRMDAISMEYLSERACNRCVSELEADKRRFVEYQKLEALHEVLGMEPPDPPDINLSDRWVSGSEGKRLPTVMALSVFDSQVHDAFERYRCETLEEAEREGFLGNGGAA
jgi:transcriptional regulator with XRE-family HTH domain